MINGAALNTTVVNGAGAPPTYVGSLIAVEQSVVIVQVTTNLAAIEQTVGYLIPSYNAIPIEQEVQHYVTSSGVLITVEQDVAVTYTDSLIAIEQRTVNNLASHLSRCGWDATIILGGTEVPTDQITGNIIVERNESSAAIAEFSIIPPSGTIDTAYYQGKSVTIDILVASGTERIFTGTVDVPILDLIDKKITFKCSDRRVEQINSQLENRISDIGYFSTLIFQDVKDTADELEKRLSTTPTSVDFDRYGNYIITPWAAKATADYTLTNSDVYYERPTVELSSRSRIINKHTISFDYRYTRLHHMEVPFTWTSPIASDIQKILQYQYSITLRSNVMSAIEYAGWPMKTNPTFTEIWPSGWYGGRAWSTTSLTGQNVTTLDNNGAPVTQYETDVLGNFILDADGNKIPQTMITGGTDFSGLFCMGASWTGTTRWAQTVTEQYTIVLNATQSQTQYGVIESDSTYSATDDFDAAIWENYKAYNDLGLGNNYYIKQDVNRLNVSYAMLVVMHKAQTEILAAHRDNRVTFTTFIRPEFDLNHTIELNTTPVQAKGKVYSIRHELNIMTGEATTTTAIAISRASGSATPNTLVTPSAPTQTITYPTSTVTLGNHFGEDPSQAGAETWTGMIGNKRPSLLAARTNYQEMFVVKVPAILESLRQEQILSGGNSYTIEIPNDLLVVVF